MAPASGVAQGAYVLLDAQDAKPDVLLLATGSEVHLALAARDDLAADGLKVRVVSMPCMDRFELQPPAERERVLGVAGTPRIAVEAASPLGWDRWTGERGAGIGMRSFGASAPEAAVYAHFGITADAIVEQAHTLLSI